MAIKTKTNTSTWKSKVVSVLVNGVSFTFFYWLFHYFTGEHYSIQGLLFQGVFFGLSMGLVFPYLLEKFGIWVSKEKS